MKRIGMIGGLAWPSTVDYYRQLCFRTNLQFQHAGVDPPYPTPPMIIESLNINDTRKLRGIEGDEQSWQEFDDVFRQTFRRLQSAGAEFGFIASNTPHMRLHSIKRGLDFPIVSILDATARALSSLGVKRTLIMGTPVTMHSTVYAETLDDLGIDTITGADPAAIAELQELIDGDLYQGGSPRAQQRVLDLCRRMTLEDPDAVVCLACTELPLAFPQHHDQVSFTAGGFRFINTTAAHVELVLEHALR